MNAPSLKTLQRRLAAEILRHAAGAGEGDDVLVADLRVPPGVDSLTRLDVYREGYPARILEALREAYPAIANICGEGSFANLVRRYLRACDVSASSLNDIGRQLPAHCTRDPLAANLPFLADLARLEWAVLCAFHSRQRDPIDAASFSTWDMSDWERAIFSFQPSLAIVHSAWPIRDLWQSRQIPRTEIDIDLTDRPQSVLVRRSGYEVDCDLLPDAHAIVLESLLGGSTLATAMASLAECAGSEEDPARMFATWLAAGAITAARLAP